MMKKLNLKSITILAMLFILMGGSVQVQAQSERQEQRDRRQRVERAERSNMRARPMIPGLSEEQKEQLKAFRIDHQKNSLKLRNELNELEAKLRTLTSAEEIKMNETDEVIDDISSLRGELLKLRIAQTAKIKSILNEEQKVIFNNQLANERRPNPELHRRRNR